MQYIKLKKIILYYLFLTFFISKLNFINALLLWKYKFLNTHICIWIIINLKK